VWCRALRSFRSRSTDFFSVLLPDLPPFCAGFGFWASWGEFHFFISLELLFLYGFFMVLFRGETIIRRGPRNSYIASLQRADISRVHFLGFLEGVSGWSFLEGFFLRKMEMSFGCHHGSFWFCFWSVELLGFYVPVLRAAAASLVV
jgi:hypothetical protein